MSTPTPNPTPTAKTEPKPSKSASVKKIRFDGLDVAAMTAHIHRSYLGYKLANVYDGSDKGSYVFKLAGTSTTTIATEKKTQQPQENNTNNRTMLLMESGIRFHPTKYHESGSNTMPSNFAMKLRKHLRNLRLENVTQLGNMDRVVDFRFGSGSFGHHVILELYSKGNIILTDQKYEILALLRTHDYGDDKSAVRVAVKQIYPVTYATTLTATKDANADPSSATPTEKDIDLKPEIEPVTQEFSGVLNSERSLAFEWVQEEIKKHVEFYKNQAGMVNKTGKKKKKGGDDSLTIRALLLKNTSGVHHYGPSLLEHCILSADIDPSLKLSDCVDNLETILPPSTFDSLLLSLKQEGHSVINAFMTEESRGYILYKPRQTDSNDLNKNNPDVPHSDKLFEEFQPHLLKQHTNRPHITFPDFASTIDEFFSLIEGQKRATRAEANETAARDRLEKVRTDQHFRVEGLLLDQDKMKEHAQLVEIHAKNVDAALSVINSALDSGMDWVDLEQLVAVEKVNQNPVAMLISRLDFKEEVMVLALPDMIHHSDPSSAPDVEITISMHDSAHGNAREMFAKYRHSKEKTQKTIEASSKALKAAEINRKKQLEEARKKTKAVVKVNRKQHWFEKFHWFVTSDNYLVLAGRDAQQNEQLVKRYLRSGDAYLHADVHGAPSCVLRAKRRRVSEKTTEAVPLSALALQEAGNFAICRSSAWASRMVTSAWWVESHQVSKTAPTGEYLTLGSFMIRGKKNFLPATQLEMGMGVLFRMGDKASIARHSEDRRDFALLSEEGLEMEGNDVYKKETGVIETTDSDSDTTENKKSQNVTNENEENELAQLPSISADREEMSDLNENVNGECLQEGPKASEDIAVTDNDSKDTAAASTPKGKKKGLSARDRKDMKRFGSLQADERTKANSEVEVIKPVKKDKVPKDQTNSSKIPRGRKSKLNKAKKKYADQDDEDRQLAMLVLHGGEKKSKKGKVGSSSNVKTVQSSSQLKAASDTLALLLQDSAAVVDKLPEDVKDILKVCISVNNVASDDTNADGATEETEELRWDKFDADIIEKLMAMESHEAQLAAVTRLLKLTKSTRIDNYSASLAGIIRTIVKYGYKTVTTETNHDEKKGGADSSDRRRKTKSEKEAEKIAWKEVLAEDGIVDDPEAQEEALIDDSAELSKLTGIPLPDDMLLYAIPVCGPYQCMTKYKFRVKLTPGSQKRGKASKQCMEIFLRNGADQSDAGNRNRNLIKFITDNEWVQNICADVKISAPGAAKAAKNQKAKNKKGGKKKKN